MCSVSSVRYLVYTFLTTCLPHPHQQREMGAQGRRSKRCQRRARHLRGAGHGRRGDQEGLLPNGCVRVCIRKKDVCTWSCASLAVCMHIVCACELTPPPHTHTPPLVAGAEAERRQLSALLARRRAFTGTDGHAAKEEEEEEEKERGKENMPAKAMGFGKSLAQEVRKSCVSCVPCVPCVSCIPRANPSSSVLSTHTHTHTHRPRFGLRRRCGRSRGEPSLSRSPLGRCGESIACV